MTNELEINDNNEIVEINDEPINVSILEKPKKKPPKIKKPRTEKQLQADKRLSEMAKKRAEQKRLDKLKKDHAKNDKDLENNLHKIADVVEEKLLIKEEVDENNLLAEASILEEPLSINDKDDNKIDIIVDENIKDVEIDIKPKKIVAKKIKKAVPKKKKVPKKQKIVYYSSDEEETDSDTEIIYKKKEKTLKAVVKEYKNDFGLLKTFPKPLYLQSNRFTKK
mgnify:CR=1 FL=1